MKLTSFLCFSLLVSLLLCTRGSPQIGKRAGALESEGSPPSDAHPEGNGEKHERVEVDGEQHERVEVDGEQHERVEVDGEQHERVGVDGEQYERVEVDGEQHERVGVDGEQYEHVEEKGEEDEYVEADKEILSLFPDPDELYDFLVNEQIGKNTGDGKNEKMMSRENFHKLYKSALEHFDVDGYFFLMNQILNKDYGERFSQKRKRSSNESYPHCDKGKNTQDKLMGRRKKEMKKQVISPIVQYPGGPIRATYGSNLSRWMKNSLEEVETFDSLKEPGLMNMLIQSLTMVKGFIQSVASSVIDIVPPLIPPPVWINRPLPCLPMVTGKNCLGSILYPITAAEFVTADVNDSIMNGIIASFPSKYASKIGKTSEIQYKICSMAYLGMYCASIFPICWLPIGLKVAETMSICFPQCLATLIACPGFWIDDIEGPCSNTSVPPFCSFSIFVNQKIVPPQLTSYDDSHTYPSTCPSKDDDYDIPDELYEHDMDVEKKQRDIFLKEKNSYTNVTLPIYTDLVTDIYDKEITSPKTLETCHCMEIIHLCRRHFALPVVASHLHGSARGRGGDRGAGLLVDSLFHSRHEEPIKLSRMQSRCCKQCKPIWKILFPKKRVIDLRDSPVFPQKAKFLSGLLLR
ncbi:conserved Plasmodium protein, unknown function [Plasmodium ovale curtisi]|uniref:Uncharacterized protein n=1 Tax=Plasmodium ovale curtisi TaxID=864141 RepID=A0A1A8VP66_PLAOA|nr:conserved Plasmodium protein, unknown function [Plasmodium ovale curtisi]